MKLDLLDELIHYELLQASSLFDIISFFFGWRVLITVILHVFDHIYAIAF